MPLPTLPFAPGTRIRYVPGVPADRQAEIDQWEGYVTGGFYLPPVMGYEELHLQVFWVRRQETGHYFPYSWEPVRYLRAWEAVKAVAAPRLVYRKVKTVEPEPVPRKVLRFTKRR